MTKVRRTRNELAHNVNLTSRTNATYTCYANVWGDMLSLIGTEKIKKQMLLAVKKLNRGTTKRRSQTFKITN
jgi:hypothetical protein